MALIGPISISAIFLSGSTHNMTPQLSNHLGPSRELSERIGVTISTLFYGINLCLFIQLMAASRRTQFNWMNVVTWTSFILASLLQSLLSYTTIIPSVHHHFETSDDLAAVWFGSSKSIPIELTTTAIGLLIAWILDICMLYQCFIVYSIRKLELWIIIFPVLFLCSSIGTGAYLVASSSGVHARVLSHYPLCISTKLVVTSLIAFKVLQQRRTIERTFQVENRKELIRPYTSLIRVLITSHALSSTVSALFLGLYISNLGAWRMILPSTVQAALASHILVRFQVVQTRSPDKSFDKEPLHFSAAESMSSQQSHV